jgi:hypothetical protein
MNINFQIQAKEVQKLLTCSYCSGLMKPSTALIPIKSTTEDFGEDAGDNNTTISENSNSATLSLCLKCEDCGHSITI